MEKSEIPRNLIVERFADRIFFILLISYVLFFSAVGILRYNYFDFDDMDLAMYSQVFWNMLHGSTFSSILGVPLLANHTDLILFLIFPIYCIIKTPVLLLLLQSFAIGLTAQLLYRFTSNLLNKTWALNLSVLYLSYPPIMYAHLYEFHPVILVMPFLVLSFSAYKDGNFFHFLIYCVLAMLCKENVPLIVAMFGVLALIDKKSIKWVIAPLALGFWFFVVLVFFIKPYFNKGIMNFFVAYREFGDTPKDIILNMLSSPGMIITRIFSIKNLKLIFKMFGFAAFLPFFSLKELIPVALVSLQHLLSARMMEKSIVFHYSAKFVPFLFISAGYGLKRLLSSKYIKELGKFAMPLLVSLLLGISLAVNVVMGGPSLTILDRIPRILQNKKMKFIKQKYIDMIPENAAVVSVFKFLPKLSNRKELYSFHHIYMGKYTLSEKAYPLPERLDYALIDFNNQFTFSFQSPDSYGNLKKFFNSYNWQAVDFDGSTVLFKNSQKHDLSKLFRILKQEPKIDTPVNGKINDEIELIGFNYFTGKGEKYLQVRFSFYWRCLKKTQNNYNSFLGLADDNGKFIKKDKKYTCYRIYPTQEWQKGEIIREDYWYVFPSKLPKRKCYLKLSMFDENKKELVKIISDKEGLCDENGFLVMLEL